MIFTTDKDIFRKRKAPVSKQLSLKVSQANSSDSDSYGVLQSEIDALFAAGGGELRLPDAGIYALSNTLKVPEKVQLSGCGKSTLRMTKPRGRMIQVEGPDTAFRSLMLEGSGAVSVAGIDYKPGSDHSVVEDVCFANGENPNSTMDSIRIEGSERIYTNRTFHDHQYRSFHVRKDTKNIVLEKAVAQNLPNKAVFLLYGSTKNLTVRDADVGPHLKTVIGNHFISGTGEANSVPTENLNILDSVFTGNPGVSSQIVNGSTLANGAAADMIAIRNTDGFRVSGNKLRHGAEFGITAVHSSTDGLITDNIIRDIDGSAIVIGAPGNGQVSFITVEGNRIRNVGLDFQGQAQGFAHLSKHSRSGIRVWNSRRVAVWDNDIDDYDTYAIYVKAGNSEPQSVFEFTQGDNRVSSASVDTEVFYGDTTAFAETATTNYSLGSVPNTDASLV